MTPLAQLADRYFDAMARVEPFGMSLFGAREYDHLVPMVSEEAEAEQRAEFLAIAEAAQQIDPAGLDATERVTRSMLAEQAREHVAAIDAKEVEFAAAPFFVGPQSRVLQYVPKVVLHTRDQAEAYLVRLSRIDAFLDQSAERLRTGTRAGRTSLARAVADSIAMIERYLASGPDRDPLRTPQPPADVDRTAWERRRDELIDGAIRPAMGRLRDTLRDDVLPAGRSDEQCGVRWLPDGDRIYAAAIRVHTTTDRRPDELHQLGLEVLDSVDAEWRGLGTTVLGVSDVPTALARLRDDPELRFGDADSLVAAAQAAVERATDACPRWFGRLPSTSCDVRPMTELEATSSPPAYYTPPAPDGSNPGVYWINPLPASSTTRFDAETIAFHEAMPGHHLQLGLSQELGDLPRFRRLSVVTAYAEGWGLYTERLADEMGLYSSDLSRLGMLAADAWRACRLVVDTGLHHFGWSRQQAIDFMRTRTPIAPAVIENEVDRYLALTGQALSYMTGRIEIVAARRRAEQALGGAFDIRGFHDAVLGSGGVPLAVLHEIVDAWVADRQRGGRISGD